MFFFQKQQSIMYTENELIRMSRIDGILDEPRLRRQYSPSLIDVISHHYDEISTQFNVSPLLLSNFARFRLAFLSPSTDRDFCPQFLSEHPALILFIISIISN